MSFWVHKGVIKEKKMTKKKNQLNNYLADNDSDPTIYYAVDKYEI